MNEHHSSSQDTQENLPPHAQEIPLTRKERKQARRNQKTVEKIARKKQGGLRKMRVWIGIGVAGIAIIAGAVFLFQPQPESPLGQDFSRAIPSEGAGHVTENEPVRYQSSPPTSGPHWAAPLRDGIYETEKPDEAVIHSLEHGRIWISYLPSISEEAKQRLQELLRRERLVILTPRVNNTADISLAAWERLDTFQVNENGTIDEKRILDFIQRYRNKGPENVPGTHGSKAYE